MRRLGFVRYSHSSLQRLGTLKVLVGLLDPQRRSVSSERLDSRLLEILLANPSAPTRMSALLRGTRSNSEREARKREFPHNVAEALLKDADAPSLLFTVPEPKVFRIRDWGRHMGFLGNGNQITERGLLLQYIMGRQQVDAIRRGDLSDPNPFRLVLAEKAYLFFILLDRDAIWPFLLRRLTRQPGPEREVISGIQADRLTCQALLDLLDIPLDGLSGTDLLHFKELRILATHMAESLRISCGPGVKVPRSLRLPPPTSRITRNDQRGRVRTNTADDQAIPRFENLVDLGFLKKETDEEMANARGDESQRRRLEWRYMVTPQAIRWMRVAGDTFEYDDNFLWGRFAHCFAYAVHEDAFVHLMPDRDPIGSINLIMEGYEGVRRPFGHTPLESVALIAMVLGLARGIVCEMEWMHQLILQIKREGLFSEYLKFASGNDLDRMFIDIRPGFRDAARRHYAS